MREDTSLTTDYTHLLFTVCEVPVKITSYVLTQSSQQALRGSIFICVAGEGTEALMVEEPHSYPKFTVSSTAECGHRLSGSRDGAFSHLALPALRIVRIRSPSCLVGQPD